MAKRMNVDAAIDSLTQGDKDASEARAHLLSTIPLPVMGTVKFSNIRCDHTLNVRDDAAYSKAENIALYESLKEFGFQVRNPFASFSRHADGTDFIISGNLRYTMMQIIRDEVTVQRHADGIAITDDNPLPFEEIHGLIWTGLSREQEIALVADQMLMRKLNQFELAKAIGELWNVQPDLTDQKIGVFFGMDRNKASRLRMVYSMPTVFNEYRKRYSGGNEPHIRIHQKQLGHLYTCYRADVSAGNKYREEGPNFKKAWNEILNNQDAFKPDNDKPDPTPDPRPKKEVLTNLAKGASVAFGETPEIIAIRDTLLFASGERGADGEPINLNRVQEGIKAYCDDLRSTNASYVDTIESLRNEVADLLATVNANFKDIESLKIELADARTAVSLAESARDEAVAALELKPLKSKSK